MGLSNCNALCSGQKTKNIMDFEFGQKVLVRDGELRPWKLEVFREMDESCIYPFKCSGGDYKFCKPYNGNEGLLNQTFGFNDIVWRSVDILPKNFGCPLVLKCAYRYVFFEADLQSAKREFLDAVKAHKATAWCYAESVSP